MTRIISLLTVVFLGSLLISSQALATGQAIAAENELAAMQIEPQLLNEEQVSEMQRLLKSQGYAVGSGYGIIDDETRVAIRQFQDTEGLTVTGHPNNETLRALAPNRDQQEFFGLSPEFGEKQY